MFESIVDGIYGRLRGEIGKVIDGDVNNIGIGGGISDYVCSSDISSVVRVNMDRKFGMGFLNSIDK